MKSKDLKYSNYYKQNEAEESNFINIKFCDLRASTKRIDTSSFACDFNNTIDIFEASCMIFKLLIKDQREEKLYIYYAIKIRDKSGINAIDIYIFYMLP